MIERGVRFLTQLLGPGKSLTHRVLRAGFWSVLIRSSLRLVGFIRNVVLARLLAPDDFGLFGIALVILSILDRFSNTGLQAALVQKKESIEEYLDTAFTVQAIRGAALALTVWFSAPYVSQFFEEARATPFLQLLAVTFFLRGIHNVGLVYYRRELEIQRQSLHHIASSVVELLVSITAAIILKNAWALMIGLLAGNLTALVVSYAVHPYRPRLRFQLAKARDLSRFGRWVFLNNILFFLAYRGDNLIVGKMLGAPALGVYMLAYSISEVITVEIGRMVTNVAFPAYSSIQGELRRLQNAYKIAVELVASFTLPAAVALWLLAEPLTLVMLGYRWLEVAWVLPPLALAGFFRTLVSNGNAAFKAVGHPDRAFLVSLIGVITTYAAIFPLIKLYGLLGVGLAVLFGQVASIPIFLVQVRRLLQVDSWMFARALQPAVLLGLAVALPILVTLHSFDQGIVVELLLAVPFAAASYLATAGLLWRTRREGPFRILQLVNGTRRKQRGIPAAVSSTAS